MAWQCHDGIPLQAKPGPSWSRWTGAVAAAATGLRTFDAFPFRVPGRSGPGLSLLSLSLSRIAGAAATASGLALSAREPVHSAAPAPPVVTTCPCPSASASCSSGVARRRGEASLYFLLRTLPSSPDCWLLMVRSEVVRVPRRLLDRAKGELVVLPACSQDGMATNGEPVPV